MSVAAIHKLLDTQLQTIPSLPQVLLENLVLNVSQNQPSFVRSTILPANSTVLTLGVNASRQMHGLYQVDVFFPSGTGSTAAQTLADTVVSYFPIGMRLTDGTFTVIVEISSVMAAYDLNKYYGVPVQVTWSCYV